VDPYPDMTSTYDSTAESMRKVRKASAGGSAKKVAKKGAKKVAKKGAQKVAKKVAAGAAGEVAKKGLIRGALSSIGLPGLIIGTLAYPVMERLIYGDREQQMRDQYKLQAKIEQEQMAGAGNAGAMGGMANLGAAPDEPSMYSLKEAEGDSLADLAFANKRNRALRSINRSSSSDELAGLLAGQEARLRSLQSPRQLTPYEIMDIIGG